MGRKLDFRLLEYIPSSQCDPVSPHSDTLSGRTTFFPLTCTLKVSVTRTTLVYLNMTRIPAFALFTNMVLGWVFGYLAQVNLLSQRSRS